jgi:hypothetical protein
VEPEGFEPSSRALDQMGRSLGNLKAERILEGDEALAARQFEPTLVVRATTEAGAQYTLSFGEEDERERTVNATLAGDDRTFVLSAAVLRQFDKSREELRDKTVISFRRTEEPTITWTEGDRRIVVVPDGQRAWKVSEPADFTPEQAQLDLAANSLLNLQASAILDEPVDLAPNGPSIEVTTVDGTQVLILAPAPDDQGRHLARVEGRPMTFVLRGAVVERLVTTFRGEPAP